VGGDRGDKQTDRHFLSNQALFKNLNSPSLEREKPKKEFGNCQNKICKIFKPIISEIQEGQFSLEMRRGRLGETVS